MTPLDVISQADTLIVNTIPEQEKKRGVAEVEALVERSLHPSQEPLPGILPDDSQLKIPFPWDALYLHYLEMRLYYFQGEIARCNQARAMYEAMYNGYRDYCNRCSLPENRRIQFQ